MTRLTSNPVNVSKLGLLALVAGLAPLSDASAAIYRVNANVVVAGDGSSWNGAMRHLSDAISLTSPGDEIWVVAATYYPDRSGANPAGTGSRTASFLMKNGVKVYGGFAGTETALSQRNPSVNVTILSGDIGVAGSLGDNSLNVVTASGINAAARLDGFTIKLGYADGATQQAQESSGGGLYVSGGTAMTIKSCRFEDNQARGGAGIAIYGSNLVVDSCVFKNGNGWNRGGGIDVWGPCAPTVTGCSFEQNQSYYGGGIYANNFTEGTIEKCQFIGNWSVNGGGLSFAGFCTTLVKGCLFRSNEARQISFYQQSFDGGAVRNWCCNTVYVNCIFNSNWANGAGAAFYDAGPSNASGSLINCTFVNNSCRDGGVIASTSGHNPQVKNSIIWNNYSSPIVGTVTLSRFNEFAGSLANPNFVDADGPDNALGTADDDLRLLSFSMALEAGDNGYLPAGTTTDYAGNPRIADADLNASAIVDLGALEFAPPLCPGDADGNHAVNFADVTSVLTNWGTPGPNGDADHSGAVNFADITSVLTNWGSPCS